LEKAKYLLESSFLSVKEITYRVGINDESHFVRDFKKAYGNAPRQHRTKASQLDQPVKIKYGAKKSLAILLPTLNLISYTASVVASSVV
jgi:AraC-like DNA-binding protein